MSKQSAITSSLLSEKANKSRVRRSPQRLAAYVSERRGRCRLAIIHAGNKIVKTLMGLFVEVVSFARI